MGCKYVRKKIGEAGNMSQLRSIVSELRAAEILLARKKRVSFLVGAGQVIPTADMYVKDYRDAYIEVVRLSDDDVRYTLVAKVVELCDRAGLTVRVDTELGRELSAPAIRRGRRTMKERLGRRCARQFRQQLAGIRQIALPIVIRTPLASFRLLPTNRGKSHRGTLLTSTSVPLKKHARKVKSEFLRKASVTCGLTADVPNCTLWQLTVKIRIWMPMT